MKPGFKFMKKIVILSLLILLSSGNAFSVLIDDIQVKKVDAGRLKYFPVPSDNKNYFFLQSINNQTQIIIGDFSKSNNKRLILITLGKDYNSIKSVVEYYPDKKNMRVMKDSDSEYFTKDIVKLKKDIITGAIYRKNYCDRMNSCQELEDILKQNENTNILSDTYGFTIKLTETDNPVTPSALFTYGKSETGYYLQFRTEFYRLNYRTVEKPILRYSVYCKDTNDPVVADLVEELFKIKEPIMRKGEYKTKSN